MNTVEAWFSVVPLTACALPTLLALVGVFAPLRAGLASGGALGGALLFTLLAGVTRGATGVTGLGVRVDAVTCVMLILVTALGAIVVRYSRTYLHGDPGLGRYLRWLLLTLSAVTTLVIANNLAVVALGWTATSLALHQLLTFFGDRTAARVAAHKKFLVSRLADALLLACLGLIYRSTDSLELDRIAAWASAHPELSPSMHVAAVLVVFAVALKSAQLPFHGWLTQVMEAPTPVSALLHAGVVNIGGFVLIRLSPLMAHAGPAQLLLVVIGLSSAIVAALVMTTRVSVKVALAWSTIAQMGFMLVQCGLGLWHLALLHLVAHSLYKAHAFLSAGTAVHGWLLGSATRRPASPSPARLVGLVFVTLGVAALGFVALRQTGFAAAGVNDFSGPGLTLLVALALVPLLARGSSNVAALARSTGVVLLFAGWHAAAAQLMPVPLAASNALVWALVCAGFVGLFVTKATMQLFPEGRLARTLYPWLFAGLYLDERFTRLTFRVWPPRLQRPSARRDPLYASETLESHT
ncbi:MAG: NADH-quinone oxidoreductase subunit L [Archangium sp.]|nr:NADH-quinone oxidoreductase subunit L [Archangium sp.]MDP3572227.1 NADH-quinone oxidoreductase subunit L [Archangium sp.]